MNTLSTILAKALSFFVPTLGGVLFFFAIIGVFGIWFAITGLLLAVVGTVIIVRRIPAEGVGR